MTALTEYPARAEEFGTRARVLPLLNCTSALGTQIVAALRLRFRLRKRDVVLNARTKCTLVSPKGCTLERLRAGVPRSPALVRERKTALRAGTESGCER